MRGPRRGTPPSDPSIKPRTATQENEKIDNGGSIRKLGSSISKPEITVGLFAGRLTIGVADRRTPSRSDWRKVIGADPGHRSQANLAMVGPDTSSYRISPRIRRIHNRVPDVSRIYETLGLFFIIFGRRGMDRPRRLIRREIRRIPGVDRGEPTTRPLSLLTDSIGHRSAQIRRPVPTSPMN